jgi:DNA-binding LacI/PurR family transcriptional regulator/DNA-binding transcriptional regulator YhcF (GntR family)
MVFSNSELVFDSESIPLRISKNHEPAYIRVEQALRTAVDHGRWPAGASLPSRQLLATEFSVSVGTVQQAIDNLIAAGVVRTEHGRGTFVTGSPIIAPEPRTSHDETSRGPLRVTVVAGIHPGHGIANRYMGHDTIVNSIERACGRMGGTVSYCKRRLAGDDWEPFAETFTRIDFQKTDAVVVVGVAKNVEQTNEFVVAASAVPVPLVFLSGGELPPSIPHVFVDNRFGGYQAAAHLLAKGHTRLTFLSTHHSSWSTDRLLGVRQALDQKGLGMAALNVYPSQDSVPSVDEVGFLSFDMTRQASFEHSKRLLASSEHPLAIVAANDPIAFGYMDAADEHGLVAGRDYSLIGFDNTDEAREFEISSFQRPWEAMAEESMRLIFAISRGQYVATQIRLQPHLVPRASTALAKWQLRAGGREEVRLAAPSIERKYANVAASY